MEYEPVFQTTLILTEGSKNLKILSSKSTSQIQAYPLPLPLRGSK